MNLSPIENLFLAILNNKSEDVNAIINQEPTTLNQNLLEFTPIFYAINTGTPEIVNAIIDKDPTVLDQTSKDRG